MSYWLDLDSVGSRVPKFFDYARQLTRTIDGYPSYVPYEFNDNHKHVIEAYDKHQFVMYKKYRQGGFSTISLMYATWISLGHPNLRIIFCDTYDRQCVAQRHRCLELLPTKAIVKHSNYHTIEFHNDSVITFRTLEASRGRAANIVFIDEAAFHRNMQERWAAIWPVIACGGKAFVYSTTNGKDNWFYDTYQDAVRGRNAWHIVEVDHNLTFNEHQLLEMRTYLGEKGYRQEILQEFLG
jgi:hypothetical protein